MCTLRDLREEDLKAVAVVHLAAFPESALTKLGAEAVHRYYRWQLTGPHQCHSIGAFVEDELAGFCFGGVFRGAMSGYLHKNRLFLVVRLLFHPWLLANPLIRERMAVGLRALRRFKRPKRSKTTTPPPVEDRPYTILSIAVDPRQQRRGIGQRLMETAEREARRNNHTGMLLTVHPDNDPAVRLYERMGWSRVDEHSAWKGLMRKPLTSGA